jgi:hypothetical protein
VLQLHRDIATYMERGASHRPCGSISGGQLADTRISGAGAAATFEPEFER